MMRRYPPITIYKYLELPSTQRIQTHNTHKHNTTLQDPGPSRPPTPPLTPPTPPQPKHTPLSPCSSRIGKAQTQSSHPQHLPPRPEPNTYTCQTLHLHLSPHSSLARHLHKTKHLNHVYHPYTHSPQPHVPRTPHQHCHHPRTLTFSQHTHMQHEHQYMHHSHRNNRTHYTGYHDNLTDRPRTTTGL